MTFEPLKMVPIELPLTRGEVWVAAWGTLREIFSGLPVWFVVSAVILVVAGLFAGRHRWSVFKAVARSCCED